MCCITTKDKGHKRKEIPAEHGKTKDKYKEGRIDVLFQVSDAAEAKMSKDRSATTSITTSTTDEPVATSSEATTTAPSTEVVEEEPVKTA